MSTIATQEWLVTVWSDEGVTDDVARLELFAGALEEQEGVGGPAASFDTRRKMLSASFVVTGADAETAARRAFIAALAPIDHAGLSVLVDRLTFEVAPESAVDVVEDLDRRVDRFAGRLELDREEVPA